MEDSKELFEISLTSSLLVVYFSYSNLINECVERILYIRSISLKQRLVVRLEENYLLTTGNFEMGTTKLIIEGLKLYFIIIHISMIL